MAGNGILQKGIVKALVPFSVASIMVLMMFTLILLIYPDKVLDDTEALHDSTSTEEFHGLDKCIKSDDDDNVNAFSCFIVVLQKFLLGGWESDQPFVDIN